MSSNQLRTTPDRLRYLVLYEGIGLALVAPLISQLFGQGVAEVGSLAIFFSIVATAWTYGWNLLFDKGLLKLCGRTNKRPLDRFLHAFGYEASFMMLSLPLRHVLARSGGLGRPDAGSRLRRLLPRLHHGLYLGL